MLAVVGGDGLATTSSRFAEALVLRIARETGVDARVHGPTSRDPLPACEVLVWAALPDASALDPALDLVLLLDEDGRAEASTAWRDALIAAGLPWARVAGAAGAGAGPAGQGVSPVTSAGACSDALHLDPDHARAAAFDAALGAALDAAAPMLRRRARPGAGLFTRLARRNAEHAGWRWTCDSCDVPECEHALRVASRMDTEPTLR